MREYVNTENEIKGFLTLLADSNTGPDDYRKTMYNLGKVLGQKTLDHVPQNTSRVCVAGTVEDLDFLTKGIVEELEKSWDVDLACFWNERIKPSKDLEAAPIIRKYLEPNAKDDKVLVITKSIISGTCVVRTNLTALIKVMDPTQIIILAPVLFEGAQQKLKSAFPDKISEKFEFVYFAVDDEKNGDGDVVPGVGGNVYARYGFENQSNKNKYLPELIKNRQNRQSALA